MADEGRPSAGDHIGPYRVERPLGAGGMGEVVLAYDERLDRRVAIKRIRHGEGTTDADRARFRREARAAAGLSHPAIVQVHDILLYDDDDAIVMELVQGQSVAERLKAGPLPLAEVLRLARDVAEGLAEAHRIGLVHRDLKAENVMMTPSGHAKILDFGLAKRLHQGNLEETLTREGALVGTVRAMAPEQAGGREVDQRSDLFSLGVLLYEMVTRHSPFRGATALLTLRRVVTESPRPVRERRPDVPLELANLIERLLEKAPEHRPNDAGEVTRTLEAIAARITADRITADKAPTLALEERGSFSDAPTGSLPSPERVLVTLSPPPTTPESGGSSMQLVVVQRRWLGATALVLFATTAMVLYWRGTTGRPEPLRVVVPRPEVNAAESLAELDLVASSVRIAALAILADLAGIAPVEPTGGGKTSATPMEVALAMAADEVLLASVERWAGNARIFLRRIRAADGEIVWASQFDVPLRVERARLVVEAMTVQLRRAYPSNPPRGSPRLEARDADFAEFVQVIQRIYSGETPLEPELRRLEAIVEGSPSFLTAQLRTALIALTLYSDTRDTDYLERADGPILRARALAPEDPAAIQLKLRAALARGERELAETVLVELGKVAPNSVEVLKAEYRLANETGDLAAAEVAMERLVERRPSWANLYKLADLEQRRGDHDGAREHLDELIQRAPENTWGLGKLAQLELLYGDLERAETLALRAIEIHPHRSYFTNLGMARFFLGRYQEAKASYLQALAIAPDHLVVRLNLADTEIALGNEEEAMSEYRRILDELEDRPLEATESMTVAQCLARLGEARRAVAVVLETLQNHPHDAEVVYQAALVYSLVGETTSALVHVERALARGFQPRQFEIPGFESSRSDPRFQALISE